MSRKVILCVDDEKIILSSLKKQLKKNFKNEYSIETAENAEEAFEVIEDFADEGQVDILLIVSDWLMPGLKGDEFLEKVHSIFPKIVKILLTGQADDNAIENAKENANVLAVVSKPWDEQRLMNLVKEGLK